jgi:hypothetical protein
MLPDYPNLKRQFRKRLLQMMQRKINQRAPLAGRIPHYRQVEGSETSYEDNLGTIRDSKAQEVRAAFTIPRNLPPLKTVQQVFEALEGAAEDMARQSETMIFQKLDESTREAGNVLDAGGRPFEPAMLLEMLDSIWIDFDDNGKPEMPTIVLHPDMFNSVKDRFQELEADRDFMAKRAKIIARKKEEWRDRESHRKLVG